MRTVILSVIMIASVTLKAQSFLQPGFMNYLHSGLSATNPHIIASTPDKKWFLNSYSGISTGFSFFNGGSASYLAVPMGLQLNRKLTENLYAFAGVSVTPAYVNFGHSFISSDINKSSPGNGLYRPNSFGMYSRAELGLMYINDAKTFSISGSIGVERSSYPMMPYQQVSPARQNPVAPHK